jgi:integrase
MHSRVASPATAARAWHMPVTPEYYDRHPLSLDEKQIIVRIAGLESYQAHEARALYSQPGTMRFLPPILDTFALRFHYHRALSYHPIYCKLRKFLFRAMAQRGTSFWEWSKQEWLDLISSTSQDFARKKVDINLHPILIDMAYLLGNVSDLYMNNLSTSYAEGAHAIFGRQIIQEELNRITSVLTGQHGRGYSTSPRSIAKLNSALSLLFLLNRSPYLEDFSLEFLQQSYQLPSYEDDLVREFKKITMAVQELGLIKELPKKQGSEGAVEDELDTTDVPEEWIQWCLAWFNQNPHIELQYRRRTVSSLFIAGRWLAANHPEVVSPGQWDENLALEYVDYLCNAKVGEYLPRAEISRLNKRGVLGNPLSPKTIRNRLGYLREFFPKLPDYPPSLDKKDPSANILRFEPKNVFATPTPILRRIKPNPRDIDEVIWCKLAYAAASLGDSDFADTQKGRYPATLYRATALLWVTCARRPNEIVRLQMGCIRRDWDPEMLDVHGLPFAEEAQLCYLQVPINKTKGPFWIPIPKYTADAVEAWERERPINQSKLVDTKDGRLVDFLFCVRGKRIGRNYINAALIPILCKKAGVPEQDAKGAITGHRARSTIATFLRKNGVSLEDIAKFLGHRDGQTVTAYAREDEVRFGRQMNRANDLMRIVEGIIDTRAAREGKPNVFFFLGRGKDGKPRFCGNPSWVNCRYRLACAKCEMYVGGGQAERLAERIELRDDLFQFQTQVDMTPQEQAATAGDIEKLAELIEKESGAPAPAPPNEAFCFNTQAQDGAWNGSPEEASTDLAALTHQLSQLKQELAEAEKQKDGRNAGIRALKKRIAALTDQISSLDQITRLTKADGFIPMSKISVRTKSPPRSLTVVKSTPTADAATGY